jgi:ubiquinone/menaquinone biosynthesis C-methylase UbiE
MHLYALMALKNILSNSFRHLGLLSAIDKCRFYAQYALHYSAIKQTKKNHPNFVFPPAYFIYETYHLNYQHYHDDGKQTAKEIIELFAQHTDVNNDFTILDWGCGPARTLRHLSHFVPNAKLIGSDYNQTYIDWCSKNLPNITFVKNNDKPPIALPSNCANAIYALSIITHLSEANHQAWINELHRLLAKDGLLLITSQGAACANKLLPHELQLFHQGKLVVRSIGNEGNRNYSAFQPKEYMQQLFSDFKIEQFIEGGSSNSIHGYQDTWLVRKK